jgi:hypothetical protein
LRTLSQANVLARLPIEEWKNFTVDDKAFMSTSLLESRASKGKDLLIKITVPKGAKGLYINEFSVYKDLEFELLLQKGTEFRIIKAEKINGKIYVEVEVIQ